MRQPPMPQSKTVYPLSTFSKMSTSFCVRVVWMTRKSMPSYGAIGIGIIQETFPSFQSPLTYTSAPDSRRNSCLDTPRIRTARYLTKTTKVALCTSPPSIPITKSALSLLMTSSETVASISSTSQDTPSDTFAASRARRPKPLCSWAATSATSVAIIGQTSTPRCPAPSLLLSPLIVVSLPRAPARSLRAVIPTPKTYEPQPSTT